jgi:hypothetical protein
MADRSVPLLPFTYSAPRVFHNHLLLARNLRLAKPAVDNTPPKTPHRVAHRHTKAAKDRERDIVEANQKLAKRMLEMYVQAEKLRPPMRAQSVKSLNSGYRARRQRAIAQENWQIARGLKSIRSSVDRGEMKKFAGRCERYKKLIAQFQGGVCVKDPMRPAMTPELVRTAQQLSEHSPSLTKRSLHRSQSHTPGRIPRPPALRCDSSPLTSR